VNPLGKSASHTKQPYQVALGQTNRTICFKYNGNLSLISKQVLFGLLDIKTHTQNRHNQVEWFITKKVIAITVSEVLLSFAITRFKLNPRLRKSQIFLQSPDEFFRLLWLASFLIY